MGLDKIALKLEGNEQRKKKTEKEGGGEEKCL